MMRSAITCVTLVNDFMEPSDSEISSTTSTTTTPLPPTPPSTTISSTSTSTNSNTDGNIMPPLPPTLTSELIHISVNSTEENNKFVQNIDNMDNLIAIGRKNTYKICHLLENILFNATSELGIELFTPFDDELVLEKKNILHNLINELTNYISIGILLVNKYFVMTTSNNNNTTNATIQNDTTIARVMPTVTIESTTNLQKACDELNEKEV